MLDVRSIGTDQLRHLVGAYDTLSTRALLPFPQIATDPVRQAIDDATSKALGLPDLSILRTLLSQEPVVCLRPLA